MASRSSSRSELEPFDPLSEGRAGDPASHTTLLQRGRVLQQLREELRRRESYSLHTRRVSSALLGVQTASPKRLQSSRRLLLLATSETAPSVSHDIASLSPATVAIAQSNGVDTDVDTLVQSAVLALWTHYRVATGFRRWKEVAKAPTDLSRFGTGVDLTIEARRILQDAELERQAALREAQTTRHVPQTGESGQEADDAVVVTPRVLETAGVRLTRDELDLLTVWAKQIHSKTFRGVDDASIGEVLRCLKLRTYEDGEPLFYEGESGEMFYIIFQGTVGVFVGMPASTKALLSPLHRENRNAHLDWSELGKRVFTYRTGDCFGETAMFSADATRTASAVAVGPCEVCELHRDVYKRTLSKYHQQFFEQAQKLNFLQRVALFRDLPRHKLIALADVLEKKRFHFGETLIAEKHAGLSNSGALGSSASSILSARTCFLVLSGVVKLTQSVEVPGQSHTLTPAEAAMSTATGVRQRKKPVAHMKIELQTVVSNEIVALEALLDPQSGASSPTKPPLVATPSYAATAASAHVDVYVLKESDARSFVGGHQSALGQKILRICETEAAHRERRRRQIQQTRLHNQQDAADIDDRRQGSISTVNEISYPAGDSVDLAAALPASPRTAQNQASNEQVPGLQVAKQPPAISDGVAPYLPHLRATNLFPTAASGLSFMTSPRGMSPTSVLSDLSVVSSPKMFSSCVRKFLFEHSDTLAADYVERLSHQFPTPPPAAHALLLGAPTTTTKTQREDQRVLEHQLSKMYDSKMHWDAKKKDFVVASPSSTPSHPNATISPRAGFLSSTPRCLPDPATTIRIGATPPHTTREPNGGDTRRHASARRKSTTNFQQELKATQQTARKLVESHLKRVGGKPVASQGGSSPSDPSSSSSSTFLHFFADT